jgi:hypothetical protein
MCVVKEKKTKEVSKKLYIEELEHPALAKATVTTLAIGEECGLGCVTTMALGEEAGKADSI